MSNKKENKNIDFDDSILSKTLEEIRKRYGNGSIISFIEEVESIPVISTGNRSLNKALGVGGIPRGRITEVYGKQGVGKSTLTAHIVSEAQKLGELCGYIDAENAVDAKYFQDIGIDISNNFLLSQTSSGEEALDILETLLKSKQFAVIIIDSVAALCPQAEIDGEFGDSTIGLMARMMGKSMRRITPLIHQSGTSVIFINQLRDNIGAFGMGPKTTTPGGKALPYFASVRIELSNVGQIKNGDNVIGNRVRAKIVKNKVAAPFKIAEYEIIFGEGISKTRALIEEGLEEGIITKGGAWYSFGEIKLGNGIIKASEFLKDNPEIMKEIEKQL